MRINSNPLNVDDIQELRDRGFSFKQISKNTGLTENTVKSRYYRERIATPSRIKSKPSNLTEQQRHRAANLHYFGYPPCEIAADIEASAEDVRIYVSELPRHPEYRKKSA